MPALNVLQVTWHGVDLVRGTRQRVRRIQHIVFKGLGLIPLVLLLRAPRHVLVLLQHPGVDGAQDGSTLPAVNDGVHKGLLVVLVIVVMQLAWDLWKWATGPRRERVVVV